MINKIYEKLKKIIKDNYKFVITLIFILVLFNYEIPYCIYTPGGKVDLSKRIDVENSYKQKGEFAMTYVSMVKSSVPFVLLSYIIPDWDLEPKENVTYDNTSLEETIEIDKLYMKEGMNNAIISAYNKANKKIEINNKKLIVMYILNESKSNLKIGDEIISVDDKKVNNVTELQDLLKDYDINSEVNVKIVRNDKEKNIKSKLIEIDGEKKLGITAITLLDLKTNPKIDIKTKKSESGPSGGLMMSLQIYNDLVKEDITNGRLITGTGTISDTGHVGKIDGVKYKLLGAERKNADIFLCPVDNYEEAMKVKKNRNLKIKIKSIGTLDEAIDYLKK